MNRSLGTLLVLVAAGCATPVPESQPARGPVVVKGAGEAPEHVGFLPIRIGVEYLPAPERDTMPAQRMLATDPVPTVLGPAPRGPAPGQGIAAERIGRNGREGRGRESERRPTDGQLELPWQLDAEALEAIDDPFQQLTLHFVNDLIGEDRRRLQREFGAPVLTTRLRYNTSSTLWTHLDERQAEAEASYINDVAPGLIRAPFRSIFKHLIQMNGVDTVIEDFKADNVPMTGEFQEQRGWPRWGRVSMRLRLNRPDDPAEVSYVNWGWRVGTSQRHCKVSYSIHLQENIHANVGVDYDYDFHDTGVRADLWYEIDRNTNLHLMLGDHMDYLAGPTAYTVIDSPFDGSSGLVFYVEHLF